MNSPAGSTGTSHTLTASQQYLPAKRSHSTQSSSSLSATDLRELTHTLQELNTNFKKNIKVLTEIKDYIVKVCEKQEARPVDDNSGVHKLDRVGTFFSFFFFFVTKLIIESTCLI